MKEALDMMQAAGHELTEELFDMMRSRPIHMETALEYINKTYGTIEKWLATVGLRQDEVAALKSKLLGNG